MQAPAFSKISTQSAKDAEQGRHSADDFVVDRRPYAGALRVDIFHGTQLPKVIDTPYEQEFTLKSAGVLRVDLIQRQLIIVISRAVLILSFISL